MNKKAFTLIEVMITTGMALAIFYLVIGFPTSLMKLYKAIDIDTDYYNSLSNISTSINIDMQVGTVDNVTPTSFSINDINYTFDTKGLYRNNVKISNAPLTFEFKSNLLKIKSISPDENNNIIDLHFYFNPMFLGH